MSNLNPNFTEVQVKGFYNIIQSLSQEVVFDLKDSVTRKSIDVSSAEEAFKAIISFSSSPQELLQRKKITRNLLIQYAFSENIFIPGNADKKEIVGKILDHWNKGGTSSQPTQLEKPVNHVSTPQIGDLSAFGLTFASWFYKMLNSHNRQMNASTPSDFGPQHFWPDSTLQTNTLTDGTAIGAAQTAERLLHFVKEGLYFNANFNDGVSTKSESHGLICVLVHGTVHKEQFCLGTFEQAFTLLQDPSNDNNWKIKNIWLNVHTQSNESRSLLPS